MIDDTGAKMAKHPATRNVFTWLDGIRARPGMYIRNHSLSELESLVYGYYGGLWVHGLVEAVPAMDGHFNDWLRYRTAWSTCCGWAHAIRSRHRRRKAAFDAFFQLVDEYRRLQPVRLSTVRLTSRHKPTGKRVVIGFDGRLEKPLRIDVIQYSPSPLHFLRMHYTEGAVDDHFLYTGEGSFHTTVEYAKEWVSDELKVSVDEWRAPRSR